MPTSNIITDKKKVIQSVFFLHIYLLQMPIVWRFTNVIILHYESTVAFLLKKNDTAQEIYIFNVYNSEKLHRVEYV